MEKPDDEIIDVILRHLCSIPNKGATYQIICANNDIADLRNQRNQIIFKLEKDDLAKFDQSKSYGEEKYLTIRDHGFEIIQEHGSYLNYLEARKLENEKQQSNSSLDDQIKILTLDNLKYQKTIRDQVDRIRDLDEQLKWFELFKKYRLILAAIAIIPTAIEIKWQLISDLLKAILGLIR